MRPQAFACVAALIAGTSFAARTPPAEPELLRAGEQIYRQGVLRSGEPLTAIREGAEPVLGANGACVNCHRRSGLGSLEERIFIPPITAKYLFRPVTANASEMTQSSSEESDAAPMRSPYTEATLARALREGIDPDGRKLHYLMPRYPLDDESMHALIGYLRRLSRGRARGVGDETLDFATIIVPDADDTERKGMLDVLDHCFGAAGAVNPGKVPASPRGLPDRGARAWRLHVWQLTGPPQGWEQQLQLRLAAEPVFAVVSGIGHKDWAPIHHFCQAESLPCLLPNVDLPVVAENDFYPVYFSRGVLLEAQLIATRLQGLPAQSARRVIQIFREDDIGAAAAEGLQTALAGNRQFESRMLRSRAPGGELAAALKGVRPDDAIVLWLRPGDLKDLRAEPPATSAIFFSGLMGGLEQSPLPPGWRGAARMSYPFELPTKRAISMDYARGWFAFKHIPVVAERTQTDTYLACGILSEAVGHMRDNLLPDYLIESVEAGLDHRLADGYYPRLRLAAGQRFASKGGYLVRFDESGTQLLADGDWIVP